ncbi:MAG: hypothetical protein FJY55_05635 [Betaproteobacteria bacterium]|nr:hypothetical protein [Betaproteobacteria bacterium]
MLRLHELLCFMRAYPDDRRVLAQVNRMLAGFASRFDLRRHRIALTDSGIAGTRLRYRYYWPTARRLAARWPAQLEVDWDALDEPVMLAGALPLIMTPIEAAWLRGGNPVPRAALARLAGKRIASGAFLVRRVEAYAGDDASREAFFDALDTPLVLRPGADTPSRTLARHARSAVTFVTQPLRRERPNLRAELRRPPQAIRRTSRAEGAQLIELAFGALVTRARDIDGIAYGNPDDVWVIDDGDGLQWAFIGIMPARRQVLRASHGFITLRSGVPIGYGQLDTLFQCSDVSFNSFDTFRGASTAWVFVRLLAAARAVLGACAFTLDGYQLGHHNDEAIASGAWWFYYKLGFRPRDTAIRRIAAAELARMARDAGHRSSPATLRRLAAGTLYFESEGVRAPLWPRLAGLGAMAADRLAALGGADREAALATCAKLATQRLGLASFPGFPGRRADIEMAWQRWAPVVAQMKLAGWSARERRALAAIIAAKGGRSERDFLRLLDAHPRIAATLRELCRA